MLFQLQNLNISLLTLALKCVGLCCHIDKDLAKKYLMIYFIYITESDDEEVWIAVTEIIFDLLLKYGIEHFEITQDDGNNHQDGNKRNKSVRLYSHTDEDIHVNDRQVNADTGNDVIKALISLLDSQVKIVHN